MSNKLASLSPNLASINAGTNLGTNIHKNAELPIALFDSGVGGLTVSAAMRKLLPEQNFLYLGDNARLPYGTKGPQTITRYALQVAELLVKRKIKLLVVACNTASAIALGPLREKYPGLPVVGVVEPGAQAACQTSTTGNIAVIATESTIRGRAYHQAIHKLNPGATIIAKACPLFVPMAEEGLVDSPLVDSIVAHYLDEIFNPSPLVTPEQAKKNLKPDCLVLGCTHFPLLKNSIARIIGQDIKIVDSANTTALAVKNLIGLQTKQGKGYTHFITTDDVQPFVRVGALFLGKEIKPEDVEKVDL